ncbi:MAG: Carboxyl-terminal protease [uncultured Solirubrobacterales bacterium]|uniref:Carboxyl-terminal protease n=1 Tax=uncultured Solirubrobacterales bacterium TaxID=768556 RepID=A0A6J4RX20_9ACTN|nr:MAG: Carboxyl-terminal protease [uncultured Solirubrobacterales bacterium]
MSRARLILLPLACALVALMAGMWLGGHPRVLPDGVRTAFVEDDRALRAEVIDQIENDFIREVDVEKLQDASLKGIISSLGDRFSHYFSPREALQFQQSVQGRFEGVGMRIEEVRRGLQVVSVFEGSPAERSGIRQGAIITNVGGESIAGQSAEIATAKIKGPPGTSVRLTLLEPDRRKTRTIDVKREAISVPTVESKLETVNGKKLGVAELLTFSSGAHGELRSAIDKLLAQGAQGIVLDLRGNGGGLLQEAVLVSSIFLEDGTVVSTDGRNRGRQTYPAEGDALDPKLPVVVLVDGGSASASEIVAGALRDRKRATLVGEKTFGKGVFQEVEPLSNGGALDLTVGRYFLPSGENIDATGIVPKTKARDDPRTPRDEGLPVALRALASQVR